MNKSYLDQLNDKYKICCPKCGELMKIRTTMAGIPVWESKPPKYEVCCFCNNNHHTFGISYNALLAIEQAIENVRKYKKRETRNKLKPCPFCGGTTSVYLRDANEIECTDIDDNPYYAVVCSINKLTPNTPDWKTGCGATGGYRKTQEKAVAAWNKRQEGVDNA